MTACGGGASALSDAGVDASDDATADVHEATVLDVVSEPDVFAAGPHGAFPQDIDGGGGVMTAPNVIPIFFAGDMLESTLESFLAAFATSSYWTALQTEYGVGPLTVGASVVLGDTPPMTATIDDVANFVAAKLEASDAGWPPVSPSNIYFLYYPSSTTLTLGSSTGCTGFAGYHSYWHTSTSQTFIFAAQARCDMLQTLDVATQNTTHELAEATTDPLLSTYASVDQAHAIWNSDPGSEIGDLCGTEALSYQRMVGTSLVARFWSNSAANQGHDPCAPPIAAPYYNSVPVLPDTVTVTLDGQMVTTSGVTVPLNTSKTINVQLFSDAPTSDWTLEAQDSASGAELTFSWDTPSGNNGATRALTITRVGNGSIGGSELVIYSQHSTSDYHAYFALAGN
jgi:hypothetical protein